MNPIHYFLENQGFVILDGAMATELERRGMDLNDPLWSAKCLYERPDLIRQTHLDYFLAGADVATSASYQASFKGFETKGFNEKVAQELFLKSVEIASEAREIFWSDPLNRAGRLRPLVAASVGPYGACLADGSEYTGNYGVSDEQLKEFHWKRLEILSHSNADLLAFETIPCLQEAEVLVGLLKDFPQKTAWLSFSCKHGGQISSGEPFAKAVALANNSPQVVAVGVNCTSPQFIESLLKIAQNNTHKLLIAYPNSGEGWDAAHHCWADPADGNWTSSAAAWYALGAKILGGCCRTTPADIARIRQSIAQNSELSFQI
ncbi:MAG: homocysteine S-methyltransferase [Saprospiraceae bacterium]|nr:homocysteine S-methyltransferase [Saprospiraceae bacterium]